MVEFGGFGWVELLVGLYYFFNKMSGGKILFERGFYGNGEMRH